MKWTKPGAYFCRWLTRVDRCFVLRELIIFRLPGTSFSLAKRSRQTNCILPGWNDKLYFSFCISFNWYIYLENSPYKFQSHLEEKSIHHVKILNISQIYCKKFSEHWKVMKFVGKNRYFAWWPGFERWVEMICEESPSSSNWRNWST